MKIISYIKESFAEVKHIKWLTKKEVLLHTISVILISLAVAYYLNVFDLAFARILDLII